MFCDKPLVGRCSFIMIIALKDTILTKKRNRLSDAKAAVLYRARENLNHIMNAKKILGKSITDSIN